MESLANEIILVVIAAIIGFFLNSTLKKRFPGKAPWGRIDEIWVEHNVRNRQNRLGMRVHLRIRTENLSDLDSRVSVLFFKANGTKLRGNKTKFTTKEGQVSVYRTLSVRRDIRDINDFPLFMPYKELGLSNTAEKVQFKVLIDVPSINKKLTTSGRYRFIASKNGGIPVATGKINDIWLDHDEHRRGKRGLLIHVSLTLFDLKGVDCSVVAYFSFSNGKKLRDFNNNYGTKDKQVCASADIVPDLNSIDYNDLELFLPYEEFHLNESAELRFKVSVYDEPTGTFFATSDYVYLSYTE